jgi:hypothetical protein
MERAPNREALLVRHSVQRIEAHRSGDIRMLPLGRAAIAFIHDERSPANKPELIN